MSMLHGGLLGCLLGETPSTKYDVESYQRQAMRDILGQQQAAMGPFAFQRQQARMYEAMKPYQAMSPRKHVESREVKGMEKARKQINGAVQAVKDAQKV